MRTHSLTTIQQGDYVVPSNDEKLVYRIRRYWEDGSVVELKGWFWGVEHVPAVDFLATVNDPRLDNDADFLIAMDLLHWETQVTTMKTRREALECIFGEE